MATTKTAAAKKKKATKRKSARKAKITARGPGTVKHILVPIDLNEESSWRKALLVAVDYARSCGATLHVVAVVPDVGLSLPTVHLPKNFNASRVKAAKEALSALIQNNVPEDVEVKQSVRDGSVYREVLDEARQTKTDVIIMASHRPSLQSYLLGVNAARVVRHAQCSVYVVRE